jgi:hypothetical protein
MNSDVMRVCGVRPTRMWGIPIVSGTRLARRAAGGQSISHIVALSTSHRTLDLSDDASRLAERAHAAGRTPHPLQHREGGAR